MSKTSTMGIVGAVAECLLADMQSSSQMLQRLSEQVGYDQGFDAGYVAGFKAAQRSMRLAMTEVDVAAGIGVSRGYA